MHLWHTIDSVPFKIHFALIYAGVTPRHAGPFLIITKPHTHHKYFFPAPTTLCLKTGLPSFPSTLAKGFITAFVHTSNTSPKNCRIASSVCGLVGLFGILVFTLDEERELEVVVEEGVDV